jgi:cell division septal protein FtsQ
MDKRKRRSSREADRVMPGPRRTKERRRRKVRAIWITAFIFLIAIGWLGYRELSSSMSTFEFSGP